MTTFIKISAADLGTNTLKVTHATRLEGGVLRDMDHYSDTVRLGFGIEQTGSIEQPRIDACMRFLKEQERIGKTYGSEAFIGVATEALRIANNGQELIDRIHNETSWRIEIISGAEEARLTYLGLKDVVPDGETCAIADIGGGSTEVVVIENGEAVYQQSLPIGSGRLADRYFASDPPGEAAVQLAVDAAFASLDSAMKHESNVRFIMLAGGSGLFMNMLIEQLGGATPFDASGLDQLSRHLATTVAQDTVDRIDIPLARAQVLPASVAVGQALMKKAVNATAIGVPSGIRMGLIREYATGNE